jgi:hypothetical protein
MFILSAGLTPNIFSLQRIMKKSFFHLHFILPTLFQWLRLIATNEGVIREWRIVYGGGRDLF